MLLANMRVAEHIQTAFPQNALLRHHAPPLHHKMADIVSQLRKLGVNLSGSR